MGLLDRLFGRKRRRREALRARPMPASWGPILDRNAAFHRRLPPDHQRALIESMHIFLDEKEFLGCAGLEITEEIRVTVAAGACLLLVGAPRLDVFPRLHEIIVYPHTLHETIEAVGPDGRPHQIHRNRAGEAWRRGPVILAWNSVQHSVDGPGDGYNVIIHEFAHVLDMQSGAADGVPPLASRDDYASWARVMGEEFRTFLADARRGRRTFFDPYGATHESEFFAVISEHFFEQPRETKAYYPALYRELSRFYGQDPAAWDWGPPTRWRPRGRRV